MSNNVKKVPKSQRGVSLLQILLATVIGAILTISAIRLAQGQRGETEFQRGLELITADVPTTLTNIYYSSGQTYAPITANAAGRDVIVQRGGVDPKLPWSDTGTNWGVGTAGTAASVRINFPCNNIGTDGATSVGKCNSLAAAITQQFASGANPLINAAPTYFAPGAAVDGAATRAGACTAAELIAANQCGISVTYARPR